MNSGYIGIDGFDGYKTSLIDPISNGGGWVGLSDAVNFDKYRVWQIMMMRPSRLGVGGWFNPTIETLANGWNARLD